MFLVSEIRLSDRARKSTKNNYLHRFLSFSGPTKLSNRSQIPMLLPFWQPLIFIYDFLAVKQPQKQILKAEFLALLLKFIFKKVFVCLLSERLGNLCMKLRYKLSHKWCAEFSGLAFQPRMFLGNSFQHMFQLENFLLCLVLSPRIDSKQRNVQSALPLS